MLGYRIALDHIDDVIQIIRGSSSRANARQNLFDFFENRAVRVMVGGKETTLTRREAGRKEVRRDGGRVRRGLGPSYIQIDAILELQLHRLTQLSVDEILKELGQIRERINELLEILAARRS